MGELQWVAHFSQLSASAALTTMLAWILYQMPRWMESERASRETVAGKNVSMVDTLISRFEQQAKYEREACDRRHAELVEASERRHAEMVERVEASHGVLREVRHEVANMAQSEANRRAVDALQAQKRHGGAKP